LRHSKKIDFDNGFDEENLEILEEFFAAEIVKAKEEMAMQIKGGSLVVEQKLMVEIEKEAK